MSKPPRSAERIGTLHLNDIDWYFRVYLTRGNPEEVIDQNILFENLRQNVRLVVAEYLSDEFIYTRNGFILAHYGWRGVTYSFWHWSDWSGTWEYFCQAWYCYGRALSEVKILDRTEPILCQHEIDTVMVECKTFRDLATRGLTLKELVSKYRRCEPIFYSSFPTR